MRVTGAGRLNCGATAAILDIRLSAVTALSVLGQVDQLRRTRDEMPAYAEEIEEAEREGAELRVLTAPVEILGKDGHWRQKADPMAFGTEVPGSGSDLMNPEIGRPVDDVLAILESFDFLNDAERTQIIHDNPLRMFPLLKKTALTF